MRNLYLPLIILFAGCAKQQPAQDFAPEIAEIDTRLEKVEALSDTMFLNYTWLTGSNKSLAVQIRDAINRANSGAVQAQEAKKIAGDAWHTARGADATAQDAQAGAEIAKTQYEQLRIGFSGLAGQTIALKKDMEAKFGQVSEISRQNAILSAMVESFSAQLSEQARTSDSLRNELKSLKTALQNCAFTKNCVK
jgi:predicted transcriptional regulator